MPTERPTPAVPVSVPEWTQHERPMEQWDAYTVASMVNVFADEHPRPKVQRVMQEAARRLREQEAALAAARAREGALPEGEWHEAVGPVLWWRFPVDEPPYVGTPLDTEWPGYHTHWTRIAVPGGPNDGG